MTPTTMRAVVLRAAGGPEQLVYEPVATPAPGRGEALVRVHAAALTRDELEWPIDRLPAIPSYELSGVVAALGPGVDSVTVGDEVYAMTAFDRDGVAADYAAIPTELLAPKPRALSHAEAAAVPLAAPSGRVRHTAREPPRRT
jgi:NADPH:quinone reductase-like Zn-dependent oxidoreductase